MTHSRLMNTKFASMQVSSPSYTAVFDSLTPNTYVMVISTDPGVRASPVPRDEGFFCLDARAEPAGILLNIKQSKAHFSKLQAATWGASL